MSNSERHTPGPWRAEGRCFYAGDTLIGTIDGGYRNDDADARLIAAAPEMLTGLRRVVAWLDRLAAKADKQAEDSRFYTLSAACRADATNYRATANDIRAIITRATAQPNELRDDERAEVLKAASSA